LNNKHPEEWFNQAKYDIGVAEFIFGGGKYIYKKIKWLEDQLTTSSNFLSNP